MASFVIENPFNVDSDVLYDCPEARAEDITEGVGVKGLDATANST